MTSVCVCVPLSDVAVFGASYIHGLSAILLRRNRVLKLAISFFNDSILDIIDTPQPTLPMLPLHSPFISLLLLLHDGVIGAVDDVAITRRQSQSVMVIL
jgi:hypothetical protein